MTDFPDLFDDLDQLPLIFRCEAAARRVKAIRQRIDELNAPIIANVTRGRGFTTKSAMQFAKRVQAHPELRALQKELNELTCSPAPSKHPKSQAAKGRRRGTP